MKIASDSSQKDGLNTDRPVSTAAKRRLFGCVTLIGAFVVGLIIAEMVLRLVGYSAPEFYVADDRLGYTLIPGMTGWYTKEGRTFVSINSDGFRDDEHAVAKPEGALRVAVIGWLFLRQNKKLWLVPIVLILLLISGLLIFAQSSALAPFIYSIF